MNSDGAGYSAVHEFLLSQRNTAKNALRYAPTIRAARFKKHRSDEPREDQMRPFAALVALSGLFAVVGDAGQGQAILSVTASRASMNPTLGDGVDFTVTLGRAGRLTVQAVDRDGFPVRLLSHDAVAVAGPNRYRWDGRDGDGRVVPDEAYSLRTEWSDGRATDLHFPANTPGPMSALASDYYTDNTGSLVYTLPAPSRVHLQTGIARKNPKSGAMEGPVMKTVVNREPRAAGRIAEHWNGFDESGTVKISDLRDFVIAIAVVPLPETSVITYGNRTRGFAEAALTRTGRTLFSPRTAHAHHGALTVLEDRSPSLQIEPLNAKWSAVDRAWRTNERTLRVRLSLSGPSAFAFSRQPGTLYRFVDGRQIAKTPRPATAPSEVEVRLPSQAGLQTVSLNWCSDFGAVAANSLRVIREDVSGAGRPPRGSR
jgi:hypothetical protein